MSGDGIPDVSNFISDGPTALLVMLLIGTIIGAYRGWWVPSYLYEKLRNDVDTQAQINEKMVVALNELISELHKGRARSNGQDNF